MAASSHRLFGVFEKQAKGILARALNLSVDQAFDVLRQTARNRGAKIHDLAATIAAAPLQAEANHGAAHLAGRFGVERLSVRFEQMTVAQVHAQNCSSNSRSGWPRGELRLPGRRGARAAHCAAAGSSRCSAIFLWRWVRMSMAYPRRLRLMVVGLGSGRLLGLCCRFVLGLFVAAGSLVWVVGLGGDRAPNSWACVCELDRLVVPGYECLGGRFQPDGVCGRLWDCRCVGTSSGGSPDEPRRVGHRRVCAGAARRNGAAK